ncbi:MAG: AAA family ATPase [Candidatus Aegiribacteria sp.]|nr:AAA family ATPase [Candidatus Aegiribacteria sp.]
MLEQLIAGFRERSLPELTPRTIRFSPVKKMASVIIGMRRSGKTCLLFQEIRRLIDSGVDPGHILYLNFEDDRLQPLESGILDRVLEAFFRINPGARSGKSYLFFDEIQIVDGWSRFARRVLDTEETNLYITGSSARMLSTEVATEFRGRGYSVEVLPFSFSEALLHRGIQIPQSTPGPRLRSKLEAAFDEYLRIGGFPDVQFLEESQRIQVLQDYVELVLLRDIIERHEVRNMHAVRYFSLALLQSSGTLVSVNKQANYLKTLGIAVGKDTLYSLLDFFIDAFLLFTVPKFHRSLRVRESNPRKIYAVDPGLAFAVMPAVASNLGARLETAVYLELRRRLPTRREGMISYYVTEAGHEVDFVVGDTVHGGATELIQVCADISGQEVLNRELRALSEAMVELGLTESLIITNRFRESIPVEGGIVSFVPAWNWMLCNNWGRR